MDSMVQILGAPVFKPPPKGSYPEGHIGGNMIPTPFQLSMFDNEIPIVDANVKIIISCDHHMSWSNSLFSIFKISPIMSHS